jgi:hypothetical protein
MRLPKTQAALVESHRRQVEGGPAATDVPAGLDPARLRKGALRLLAFAAFIVVLILAVPGLGSIRHELAHGDPAWLVLAACFRLSSALCYVALFRVIFSPKLSRRLSYRIGMSEIGVNALVPAGGAGGLAIGDWVLHRRGVGWEELGQRSAEFFVFTSAFNVGAVAALGWLGAVGILSSHVSRAYSAVPALGATLLIAVALAVTPHLAGLKGKQEKERSHSLRWWVLELAVALGTGASGAVDEFRKHDPRAIARCRTGDSPRRRHSGRRSVRSVGMRPSSRSRWPTSSGSWPARSRSPEVWVPSKAD